jgi:hypothetical protein
MVALQVLHNKLKPTLSLNRQTNHFLSPFRNKGLEKTLLKEYNLYYKKTI